VAKDKLKKLKVFDYKHPTIDETGVKGYIYVVDFAEGHMVALGKLIGGVPYII
jgi:UDP-glucose 4-epimerase